MELVEVTQLDEALTAQLLAVWESAVTATHQFLTAAEMAAIKKYVPTALQQVAHLVVGMDETRQPLAFMGVADKKLKMLFVRAEARGRGIGKQLLAYGMARYAVQEVTVNEENPQAIGFYQHMGFQTIRRPAVDEQGNAYPILYMKR